MRVLIHRIDQTAHISLQILSISKSAETKSTRSAISFWRNLRHIPQCFLPSVSLERRSVVPSGVPLCASAPPVRGYLRIGAEPRNPFFRETSCFFQESRFPRKIRWLQSTFLCPFYLRPRPNTALRRGNSAKIGLSTAFSTESAESRRGIWAESPRNHPPTRRHSGNESPDSAKFPESGSKNSGITKQSARDSPLFCASSGNATQSAPQ
jgi:hypothetical protein